MTMILDPSHPLVAGWLADRDAAIMAALRTKDDRRAAAIAANLRRAQERREAQARAAKLRERTRKANAEARRRARAAAALAAGRTPGINGRPRTGTHPRASYWREYIRRSAAARRAAKQESKP